MTALFSGTNWPLRKTIMRKFEIRNPKFETNSKSETRNVICHRKASQNRPAKERKSKRQRTAALQDAAATDCAPLHPRGFGVRLSSAAFAAGVHPCALLRSLTSCCSFWSIDFLYVEEF